MLTSDLCPIILAILLLLCRQSTLSALTREAQCLFLSEFGIQNFHVRIQTFGKLMLTDRFSGQD